MTRRQYDTALVEEIMTATKWNSARIWTG